MARLGEPSVKVAGVANGRRPNRLEGPFRGYTPTAHDVFVCSFFKAGTTWTPQIATQIAFRGQAEFDNLHHAVPFVPEARYIVVTRDPKGCCVSGYHFLKSLVLGPLMPSVARWVDFMFSRDFHDGWAEHLASYWRQPNRPNVLFLTYEELRSDHMGGVRRAAAG